MRFSVCRLPAPLGSLFLRRRDRRSFTAAITIIAAFLFLHTAPASAQTQTYVYVGQPFDVPYCNSQGFTGVTCVDGSITMSITFNGVTSGYIKVNDRTKQQNLII